MGGPWAYGGGHDFAMHGPDKEFYDELVSTISSGIVGRGMYDAAGAREGPIRFPGHCSCSPTAPRTSPPRRQGFTFVSGLEDALAQARAAAGSGDVSVGGGAEVIREALAAGQVDELVISTAPVILGAGKRSSTAPTGTSISRWARSIARHTPRTCGTPS
jgi:dihydrofolate reductase